MKNLENLPLLRNYLAGNAGRAEYQDAIEELNRQLEIRILSRADFLHDLGFATVNGEDAGCDSRGLAESASRDFPTLAVATAMADYEGDVAYDAVRGNSPELFDLVADAEQIIDGYATAASALPPGMTPEEVRDLLGACDCQIKPTKWGNLRDRKEKVAWIQEYLGDFSDEPDHSSLYDAIIKEIEALPEVESTSEEEPG